MSTPSTATALAPLDIANPYAYSSHHHHHSHVGSLFDSHPRPRLPAPQVQHYHHQHAPLSPLAPGVPPSQQPYSSTTATRPAASAALHHHQHHRSRPEPSTSMATSSTQRRQRRPRTSPDWEEFYKNGPPKEIIVIDDDDDDSAAPTPSSNNRRPAAVATTSRQPATSTYGSSGHSNGTVRHADKKRKIQQPSQYDAGAYSQHQPSYSTTHTPHLNGNYSSPTTVSAQSSSSSLLGTTAETSLGSARTLPVSSANGTKRKRYTRSTAAAAADAFASYHPPPQPPIKAPDVIVQVVRDPEGVPQQRVDDQDGHYIVNADTELTTRYRIIRLLGQGTFGKVVEAYDHQKKTKCAIKIIRSVQKYRDASRIELRVLATLSANDKDNRNKCIHLRDCFDYRQHICIVTDLLGQSVFDFLKANSFAPFPNSHIQNFARQLLTSVAFLHDLNLIHTDLKPENILLVNGDYRSFPYNKTIPSSTNTSARQAKTRRVLLDTDIRLIDFGSATFDDEYHSSVVSTRHYRAPEIILGLGWSFPCDIWSIGCILVEFFTGDALFQTHDNLEHLAMMQLVCGPKIDTRLVKQIATKNGNVSTSTASRYFKSSKLNYPSPETTKASRKYVQAMKKIDDIIPDNSQFNRQFIDLLKKIFVYDPHKRITAKEALKHPWFRESTTDEGTVTAKELAQMKANYRDNSYEDDEYDGH